MLRKAQATLDCIVTKGRSQGNLSETVPTIRLLILVSSGSGNILYRDYIPLCLIKSQ